jgi:GxxExxY protein
MNTNFIKKEKSTNNTNGHELLKDEQISDNMNGGKFALRAGMELIFKDEVYAIMGAAMDVHSNLGSGFLEAVYQEAMEKELVQRDIPFEAQKPIKISYKNQILKKEYTADLVCYGKIIVELKAQDKLSGKEEAQILNYLKATTLKLGVVINFGSHPKLEWKRLIL